MAKRHKSEFFQRKAEEVAQKLVGRTIERYVAGQQLPIKARIVVAGAYEGLTGNRKEQQGMYSAPGQIYLMSVRGNSSLNFGTVSADAASVVCVVGVQLTKPSGLELIIGPGKVTRALELDERFNGLSLDEIPDLSIKGRSVGSGRVLLVPDGTRIGSGQGANRVNYSSNCIGIYALADIVKTSER